MSDPASKAVFLSYASQDADAAKRICAALRAAEVEVWFDQSELRGGDAWDANIREQIESCALFVPVISANTQARREGYFRLEWNLADDRTHLMAGGTPFLVPVVIDGTQERGALVPKSFLGVQWTRLPGGETPDAFVQRLQNLLGTRAGRTAVGAKAAPSASVAPRSSFPLWATAVLGAALLGLGAYFALRTPARETPAPIAAAKPLAETKPAAVAPRNGAKSIAVLPFVNRSTEKENEFFTDGMHDDILTHLSRIRELHVTSRTSVEQYRATKKTTKQVGEELGVAYVLEGSVQRSGSKVRVTGQRIRAAADEHRWAQNYDRDLTAADVFAIQSEVAQIIARELGANISPREKTLIEYRPTENTLAYDLYLKSRDTKREFVGGGQLDQRIAALTTVVGLDPKFAVAWAELGSELAYKYRSDANHPPDTLVKGKHAIETAVGLAPDLPDVLVARGRFHQFAFRDFAQASLCFESALQQNPNDAMVHFSLGNLSRVRGRQADSVTHYRRALELDPDNGQYRSSFASTLEAGRRYEEALAVRRRLLPASIARSYSLALVTFEATGSTREVEQFFAVLTDAESKSTAVLELRRSWAVRNGNLTEYMRLAQAAPAPSRVNLALVLSAQGNRPAALAELGDTSGLKSRLEKEPANAALWSALGREEAVLGRRDEALRCVRKAMELLPESVEPHLGPRHSVSLAFVYAWTGALRGDPRFEALLNDPKNNEPLF